MLATNEFGDEKKGLMSTILPELRYALRQLRRDPGFALVSILTLGVGIGATTVVFGVFNGTVLQGLSGPGSERIARIACILLGAVGLLLLMASASV